MHEKNHARGKMSISENAAVKSVWLGWSYFNCYLANLSESRHLEQTVPRALRNALRKCFEHTRQRQTEQILPANSSRLAAQIAHRMGAIEILIMVSRGGTRFVHQLMACSYYFPPYTFSKNPSV